MLSRPTTTIIPFSVPLPTHLWPLKIILFIGQSFSSPARRLVRLLCSTLRRVRYSGVQRWAPPLPEAGLPITAAVLEKTAMP
jgi:hypothetical protein